MTKSFFSGFLWLFVAFPRVCECEDLTIQYVEAMLVHQ